MERFESMWSAASPEAQQRAEAMRAALAEGEALRQRAVTKSAKAQALFDKRGQLLPRQRVALLVDPGAPYLPLSELAGYLHDHPDPAKSVPGGGVLAGIGFISGVRCMIVASDSGIDAGAVQAMGLDKILRAQDIALDNKLPFVHLVESAGANLMRYRVEGFVHGGRLFKNLARHSAAGLPVLTIQHGSGTAGGAYMPGLSDAVIMVRGRSRAFLAGPPLLKAATGEVATEEDLGGAEMHTMVSGLGEYLAEDDRDAIATARELIGQWQAFREQDLGLGPVRAPRYDANDLLGVMPANYREPVDMRELMVRLVDDSQLLEFKPLYGSATVCAQATWCGHAVGLISNNGPIDVAGANKATHFIHTMCQLQQPIIYLQNTTGYMVGTDSEQAGMIKHGSKMIQAVTSASVPQFTVQCGASFGAGNYGMCGRGYDPKFLFSWPNAKTAVMGGEQAATTMRIVAEAGAKRKGLTLDEAQMQAQYEQIVNMFDAQSSAWVTSGLMLDDGVIDPRHTREVIGFCLDMHAQAQRRRVKPLSFGVGRM